MEQGQQLFQEIEKHITEDARPSDFFRTLGETSFREFPFSLLGELKKTNQSPVYHPEGLVWNHTMLVIDEAARRKRESSDERAFMWAALLHDIGKPGTTRIRKGKITSYNHEKTGAELARRFLEEFVTDGVLIDKVAALIRWHMQILHVVKSPAFAEIESMKRQVAVADVALLGLCDRLGRFGSDRKSEEENIRSFLEKCK